MVLVRVRLSEILKWQSLTHSATFVKAAKYKAKVSARGNRPVRQLVRIFSVGLRSVITLSVRMRIQCCDYVETKLKIETFWGIALASTPLVS